MINNYTEEDVLNAFKEASETITDDCTMSGAEILMEILTGKSIDAIYQAISEG